jgi:uncharacterized SAM-binding protein YcdF (DUF218 family)
MSWRWISLLLIVMVVSWDLGRFVNAYRRIPLQPQVPSQPVDLIVALTGGLGRVRESIELLKDGLGAKLFISGVENGVSVDDLLRANDLSGLAPQLRGRILLGTQATSTLENASEVRQAVELLGARTILLVTSRYHLPRATGLVKRELDREPSLETELSTFAVDSPNFPIQWHESLVGWGLVLSEYFKSFRVF